VNDPNDWCKEHGQPRYSVDLIGRVVRVSMETMKIVTRLPGAAQEAERMRNVLLPCCLNVCRSTTFTA